MVISEQVVTSEQCSKPLVSCLQVGCWGEKQRPMTSGVINNSLWGPSTSPSVAWT